MQTNNKPIGSKFMATSCDAIRENQGDCQLTECGWFDGDFMNGNST